MPLWWNGRHDGFKIRYLRMCRFKSGQRYHPLYATIFLMSYHVHIKQGNLLDEADADFIVNPSNTRLTLGSGVSGAFSRACGPSLQTLMSHKLQETGPLKKGDVVPTPPGGCSRFRTVLHAAVMDYNPGARETAPLLDHIATILGKIENILSSHARMHSGRVKLVLPLMGTGVGGLDKRDVVLLYRECFARKVPFDCDVILYAHSENDYRLMTSLPER